MPFLVLSYLTLVAAAANNPTPAPSASFPPREPRVKASVIYGQGEIPVEACPEDMATLPGFCMDHYEAPNFKGAMPLVAKGATEGEEWCALRGKRLCTEFEFERACEGKSKRDYPYGNEYKRGVCNDDKTWRVVDWGKVQCWPGAVGEAHINWLNQSEPSGSRPGCVSEEGVYDLAGNVSEWIVRSRHTYIGYKHGMVGCYWSGCYVMHLPAGIKPGCHGTLNPGHPGDPKLFRTYEAGFRCCLSLRPEPKTGAPRPRPASPSSK